MSLKILEKHILKLIFIFFVLLTIFFVVVNNNSPKNEDKEEIVQKEYGYIFKEKPFYIYIGEDYHFMVNTTVDLYDYIDIHIAINNSKVLSESATDLKWYINNEVVDVNRVYYPRKVYIDISFDKSYCPSEICLSLKYNETVGFSKIQKVFESQITFSFLPNEKPDKSNQEERI